MNGLVTKKPPPLTSTAQGHAKPNGNRKKSSWAQIVNGKRVTLLSTTITKEGRTIVKSRIFRHGYSAGSVLFDMSTQKNLTMVEMDAMVKEQYYSRLGAKALQVGNLRYAEVIFALDDENIERCLNQGLNLDTQQMVILPCQALTGDMEIIHLKLSELPFESENELLQGLIVEPTTDTYSGKGYVTINIKCLHTTALKKSL